jgi:glycosyltransferase involved in cell wall biosynthesis
MILIDALYINSGGGKELLDILVDRLKEKNVHFLIDQRLLNNYNIEPKNVTYLKANIFNRHFFYLKHRLTFSFVFCFANIPPTIKLNCFVVTYFHNVLLLNTIHNFNLFTFLKQKFIHFFEKNTDRWFVQSQVVKNELILNSFNLNKIDIYPFFDDRKSVVNSKNTPTDILSFLYVSSGEPHKNHILLLEAFEKYSLTYPNNILKITIDNKYVDLLSFVKKKALHNVINLGFIQKDKIINEYTKADVIIFPSLRESFGLGLIEAAQLELPIIASDLNYVHEVVIPSCVFDPYNSENLFSILLNHKLYITKPSKLIVNNKLNELIFLILSYSNNTTK